MSFIRYAKMAQLALMRSARRSGLFFCWWDVFRGSYWVTRGNSAWRWFMALFRRNGPNKARYPFSASFLSALSILLEQIISRCPFCTNTFWLILVPAML